MLKSMFFNFWIMPISMILVIVLFYRLAFDVMAPLQLLLAAWLTSLINAVVITQQLSRRYKHLQNILTLIYFLIFIAVAKLQI
jgi:hypothetical protein